MSREVTSLESSIRDFALKHHYQVDEENVQRIIKGLLANKKKFGGYYCPCRRVNLEDKQYLIDITCPCKYVHSDIQKHMQCHCMLYQASTPN